MVPDIIFVSTEYGTYILPILTILESSFLSLVGFFASINHQPSATVCHMWDIWLVERSFKIFFRVGTAILFLSQPILLNHELEGMMGYLNTFPDATLLSPDILIACSLQIKITNRMLMEIEKEIQDSAMTC